ncbi:hypothetical protein [Paraburkholderia sp.]|uniref:hypothetical protein n=1 Tax=Paraburkholderia sp. TaxID=1926495 RepID=UPI00239B5425|nr:hypothetical protein [Paraburkholderia sp.]MDE1182258.1 hypothetical protein [Paraburkholderia sp.]
MQQVTVTWERAARIWWAFTWRATLVALASGVLVGLVFAIIGKLTGTTTDVWVTGAWSLLSGVAASLYGMRRAMSKRYADFRIVLVQDDPAEDTARPTGV